MKRSYFAWGFPLTCLLLLLIILATGTNTSLFYTLNQLSKLTGDGFWAHTTLLGDTLLALTLLLPLSYRHPKLITAAIVAAVLAALWVHGLKNLFDLSRPAGVLTLDSFHIIGKTLRRGSFPSGHTTTAMTLAALVWIHIRTLPWRYIAIIVGLLAGLSRIVVGAHWPMDVLAGYIGGFLCAMAGTWLAARWRWGKTEKAQHVFTAILFACGIALLFHHKTGYPGTDVFRYLVAISCLAIGTFNTWHILQKKKSPN